MSDQSLEHLRLRQPELGRGMLAEIVVGFALVGVELVGDFELLQQVDGRSHDGCLESNRIKTRPNSLRLTLG